VAAHVEVGEIDDADAQRFFDLSRSLFVVVDTAGVLLRMSPHWERVLDRPLANMVGRHFSEFLHPDDVARTTTRMKDARHGHGLPPLENRYLRPDGSFVWLSWDTSPVTDGTSVWCIATEVTAAHQRAAQQQLVADLGRRALEGVDEVDLLDAAVIGTARALQLPIAVVLQLRPEGDLLARAGVGVPWNPVDPPPLPVDDSTMSGRALRSRRLVCSTDVGSEVHPSGYQQAYGAYGAISVPVGRADRPWGVLTCADRRPRSFDEAEQRFVEQVAHVLGAAIERRAVEHQLQHQATHDGLTGLPNRALLRQRIATALVDSHRQGTAVGLLLCDLDGFKDVNDSLGHAAGDEVLQQLAGRLVQAVGDAGMVARLGGDEFAICVRGPATELEVLGVADAIVKLMREPFSLSGMQIPLSTSIGVAVSPTHGQDAATLLKHADVAMYRAKSSRLGWALYDASLDQGSAERLTLTADLREAVVAERLQLHYQPVVDLHTGELVSLEALCRWNHPTRGNVPPGVFVPLAEHAGLIGPLTQWVVAEALQQVRAWKSAGHGVPCAINLSMAAVTSLTKSASLLEQLIEGAPDVTVEITESWLADDRGKAVVSALASAGVSLALDDFGTGWSSLAVLASFPVTRLKLDRQFLMGLDGDARGSDLLRAITDLATALEMDVVAEGIERRDTAQLLRDAGIGLGQGMLWAPPLPADEVPAWAGWT
jgi:diguanylate cyclase (GGDEF)-like protein/PAS domain S-box-containing protein